LTIEGVIVGNITVALTNFQDFQLKFSSTDVATVVFKFDGAFFPFLNKKAKRLLGYLLHR
jgi:hypothetical protein